MTNPEQTATPKPSATPTPNSSAATGIALLLGGVLGLFGAVMLVEGSVGLVLGVLYGHRVDLGAGLWETGLFIFIGIFCLGVSVRWLRSSRGSRAGKGK